MYLISVYFDERTDNKIRCFMKQIVKCTGNTTMLDGDVPPHITISAFQTESEAQAKEIFRRITKKASAGEIQWVSVGAFLPQVIYLSPVLNEYLHELSVMVYKEVSLEKTLVSRYYQPFAWLPHTTLGKTLNKEQMQAAFEVLQNQFGPFKGNAAKIGLAKTNPYADLEVFELK